MMDLLSSSYVPPFLHHYTSFVSIIMEEERRYNDGPPFLHHYRWSNPGKDLLSYNDGGGSMIGGSMIEEIIPPFLHHCMMGGKERR